MGLAAGALLAAWLGTTALQAQTCTTAITGKVYAPNNVDPLPNVLVYIPTTPVQPFTNGVNSCKQSLELVSGNPVFHTLTTADGSFTLTDPSLAGTNVPLVIQAGKWRRQMTISNVPACATTTFPVRMPQTHLEGDIPQFAVVTGAVDQLECSLRKVGIADSEFTNPGGSGRVNFYLGDGSAGAAIDRSTPPESTLTFSADAMNGFDIVMLPCQGGAFPKSPAEQTNLINYADVGGRVFATHYSYVWLYDDPPFAGTARWTGGNQNLLYDTDTVNATISSSFSDAKVLAQWLLFVGASTTLGQVPLQILRKNQNGVNPPAQSWFTLNDAADGNPVMQFTFDTPITGTQLPAISLGFTNAPANFLRGDSADSIAINVSNTSTAAADASLKLSIRLAAGLTATSLAGANFGSGWACSLATLSCTRTDGLAGRSSDPVTLVLSVAADAPVGNEGVATVTVSGGGISDINQCGRVLFNEYHVENPAGGTSPRGKTFPNECSTAPMTPQEKLLEYSLFDLSNFVAPVSVDTITVQGKPVVTWPTPAPIYFGTALSATQLNATASVPGTFVYTPAAGTITEVGLDTLNVVFTPTDTLGYSTVTASVQLQVSLIPTTSLLALCVDQPDSLFPCGTPITATPLLPNISMFFGQVVDGYGQVNAVDHSTLTGDFTFFDGTTNICKLPAGVGAQCPASTGTNFAAGVHDVTAVYGGDASHAGSTSNLVVVTVLKDVVTATIASSLNPADFGSPVTFTAKVKGNYATAPGSVVFMDGSVALGTVTLDASGMATFTTSSLAVGLHPITVVYAGGANFQAATSPVLQELIRRAPVVMGTAVLLGSGANPSVLGQNVIFTAQVITPGPFIKIATGTVTLLDGTALVGKEKLDTRGIAQFTTSALAFGSHNITASYGGDAIDTSSVSPVLVQVVNSALQQLPVGFTINVTPVPVTVATGSIASMLVTVTPISGFNMPVTLGCSGLPTESTCTFGLEGVPVGGATTTMQLSTMAPHDCGIPEHSYAWNQPRGGGWGLAGTTLAGLVLLCAPGKRRRWMSQGLLAVVAIAGLAALNGCGHCTDLGTPPGVYTFSVTGTAAASSAGVLPASAPATVTQKVQLTVVVP